MNNDQIVSKLFTKKSAEVLLHNKKDNISYLKIICRYCLEINKVGFDFDDEIYFCYDCDNILNRI
jgi:hypothetical protein